MDLGEVFSGESFLREKRKVGFLTLPFAGGAVSSDSFSPCSWTAQGELTASLTRDSPKVVGSAAKVVGSAAKVVRSAAREERLAAKGVCLSTQSIISTQM